MLDIPLPDPPRQDTLQNTLSGWCGIFMLPSSYTYLIYRLARLPLDSLSNRQDKALMCVNCNMFPVDCYLFDLWYGGVFAE